MVNLVFSENFMSKIFFEQIISLLFLKKYSFQNFFLKQIESFIFQEAE